MMIRIILRPMDLTGRGMAIRGGITTSIQGRGSDLVASTITAMAITVTIGVGVVQPAVTMKATHGAQHLIVVGIPFLLSTVAFPPAVVFTRITARK